MGKRINFLLEKLSVSGRSNQYIALSCALGIYIAFSPFVGIQTLLAFFLALILRADAGIAIAILWLINNPFSSVPILTFEYVFGRFLVSTVWHADLTSYNHVLAEWINQSIPCVKSAVDYLGRGFAYFGMDNFCFLSLMIGANVLAIGLAIPTYFVVCRLWQRRLLHRTAEGNQPQGTT